MSIKIWGMDPTNPQTRLPHESPQEARSRRTLTELLHESPIPPEELIDNLGLYLGRKQLMDLLAMDSLYKMIKDIPGTITEFGPRWGRHLSVLTALRALYEPYNVHRRIIGFDTFAGFPDVTDVDQGSRHARVGGLSVTPGYEDYLDRVLATQESTEPLSHVRRTYTCAGDVRQTLPEYLAANPQTIIAMAYFDLDLYEPTRDVLTMIQPYLAEGSVLAFDQIGHAKWPGETIALREVLGTTGTQLEVLPSFPGPVFMRWQRPTRRPGSPV